jgi:hypothetical protein
MFFCRIGRTAYSRSSWCNRLSAPKKITAFELVEVFHLAYAAYALHGSGVLRQLNCPSSAHAIATANGLNLALLTAVLDFLAERTELIERNGEIYRVTEQYNAAAMGILDQYLGAYGPHGRALADILRNPSFANGLIDRDRHAAALESLPGSGSAVLPDVLARNMHEGWRV